MPKWGISSLFIYNIIVMSANQMTVKTFFYSLQILFFAMIAGLVLFAIVAYYLNMTEQGAKDPSLNGMFYFIVPSTLVLGIIGGQYLSNAKFQAAKEAPNLSAKLEGFRTGMILRYATIEGPGMLAIVAYLLTNNFLYLVIGLAGILFFLRHQPTKDRAIEVLDLDSSERATLNNDDAKLQISSSSNSF